MSAPNSTKARYSETNDDDLPSGWAQATLGDLLPLSYGKALGGNERISTGSVPVYGSSGAVGTHNEAVAAENSIIVGRKGAAGAVYFSRSESWPIDTAYYTTPSKWLEARFWFYQLSFLNLRKLDQSTAIPSLSRDNYNPIQVGLPPLTEQTRIVSKIDELFSRIEAGEKALQRVKILVERYRKSVLKAAVTGELTKEWRENNKDKIEPASKLLERILKSRREAWEQSELPKMKAKGKQPKDDAWKKRYVEPAAPDTTDLPDLPEGWVWVNWGSIGKSQNGRPFPSSEYQDHGVKLLRPGNLFADGSVRWTKGNSRFLPSKHEGENFDFIVGPNELVINLTAQSLKDDFLGRVCLTQDGEHSLLNQRLARLTPIVINPRFMLIVFKSPLFRDYVLELNTGSLIQHMFTSQMELFAFPLPPLAEQELIVARVENVLGAAIGLALATEREQQSVDTLKQSILKSAFEGKLVPQESSDEPASALLERIRSATAAPKPPKSRKVK